LFPNTGFARRLRQVDTERLTDIPIMMGVGFAAPLMIWTIARPEGRSMPSDAKPLFRPEAVRPKVRGFALPAHADRAKAAKWAKMLAGSAKLKLKETEVRDEFLYDIFRDALGYVTVSQNPAAYSFKKEQFVQVDGTYADAGFGRFGVAPEAPVLVLEGKGPSDPLDRPYAGRKHSGFEQALLYALNLKIDWFVVTNLRETRLYCK